ncbi:hypothetical protein BST97_13795 [Nonlabens spongiae]|uniref:Uncharacterized protein n=1 Tax=Nonlabens spongiae TaxID=331648 RepID=A0A1W6MMZ0_9FLAO|nr:hypothetical protein BST97_13795 [Nonlabens spongiae]
MFGEPLLNILRCTDIISIQFFRKQDISEEFHKTKKGFRFWKPSVGAKGLLKMIPIARPLMQIVRYSLTRLLFHFRHSNE